MPDEARDDFDRPWKEALERYFPEFVAAVCMKAAALTGERSKVEGA